jgi:hypothetical protein
MAKYEYRVEGTWRTGNHFVCGQFSKREDAQPKFDQLKANEAVAEIRIVVVKTQTVEFVSETWERP